MYIYIYIYYQSYHNTRLQRRPRPARSAAGARLAHNTENPQDYESESPFAGKSPMDLGMRKNLRLSLSQSQSAP